MIILKRHLNLKVEDGGTGIEPLKGLQGIASTITGWILAPKF
jgi:hypothetical protein